MSNDTNNAAINSQSWWEDNFTNHWENNNGRSQTRHFMEGLTANLPETEREFLLSRNTTILDWGCALGDGVDVLAKNFPKSQVVGLDYLATAITQFQHNYPQYEFLQSTNGQIDREFDVVISSDRLQHFDDPLAIVQEHLRSCRQFYAAFVPYRETPLSKYHKSQFREECFPEKLLGFTRIYEKVTVLDAEECKCKQMLVIYASANYINERNKLAGRMREKEKWNAHYGSLPPPDFSYYSQGFSGEFADRIEELLPNGGTVMEIGCGGGEQSLALGRKDKYDLTLVDFSEQALDYAKKLFALHHYKANFQQCDAFSSDSADFDLVFNAGVLEHYTHEEQVAFLRSMAGRSRKYVLVLVPNYQCYWYWVWRNQQAGLGLWPYGREVPTADLSKAFKDANLNFLGHAHIGAKEAEYFIKDITGLDDDTRNIILHIHRSGMIPESQTSYLLAALGSVSPEESEIPACWTDAPVNIDRKLFDMTATLSDALSGRISAENRHRKIENILTERDKQNRVLSERLTIVNRELLAVQSEISAIKLCNSWRLFSFLQRTRVRLVPFGSRREKIMNSLFIAAKKTITSARRFSLRGMISRIAGSAITHCPRWIRNYADRRRSLIVRFLPQRIKEYIKTSAKNAAPNIPLRKRLDQFIANQVVNNSSNRVFLIYSGTEFTELEGQRPLRFARELARRGVPVIFAYWRWNAITPIQESTYPGVFCLPIDEFQKDYEILLGDARLATLKKTFLMEFPHSSLIEMVNHANTQGWQTVYDVIDDWEEFKKCGQAFWYDRDMETYLLHNSDFTAATCENLKEKMASMGADRLHLLPNAFEDWKISTRRFLPPINKGKITVGYFGHLTSSWFDWDLLTMVAKRRPDWSFNIIGYGLDKHIAKCDNLHFLGKIEHCNLPAYAKNWDVAVIPFRQSNLSMSVDPIKIYEYISLGLPTVVTGMSHLASYPGVLTADNDVEFEAAIEKAAVERIDQSTVENFINQNRWSNRIDALLKLLDEEGQWSAASLALGQSSSSQNNAAA